MKLIIYITKYHWNAIPGEKYELECDGNGTEKDPVVIKPSDELPKSFKIIKNKLFILIKGCNDYSFDILDSENITIDDCEVKSSLIHNCKDLIVQNFTVNKKLKIHYCNNIKIEGCRIKKLELGKSNHNKIVNNQINNIRTIESEDNVLEANEISPNYSEQLKKDRFVPVIFGIITLLFIILVIIQPSFKIEGLEIIESKMILFFLGFVSQMLFFCFDVFKIGASSSGAICVGLLGAVTIVTYTFGLFEVFLLKVNFVTLVASNILLFEILKIITSIINKDNVLTYRIWLGGEGISSLVLSILVLVFSKGNDLIIVMLISICLLLAVISNILYSILWKTEEGIKGTIEEMKKVKEGIRLVNDRLDAENEKEISKETDELKDGSSLKVENKIEKETAELREIQEELKEKVKGGRKEALLDEKHRIVIGILVLIVVLSLFIPYSIQLQANSNLLLFQLLVLFIGFFFLTFLIFFEGNQIFISKFKKISESKMSIILTVSVFVPFGLSLFGLFLIVALNEIDSTLLLLMTSIITITLMPSLGIVRIIHALNIDRSALRFRKWRIKEGIIILFFTIGFLIMLFIYIIIAIYFILVSLIFSLVSDISYNLLWEREMKDKSQKKEDYASKFNSWTKRLAKSLRSRE